MMQNKINELLAEIENLKKQNTKCSELLAEIEELKKQNTKCSELLEENKTLKEENTEYKALKNYGLVWENEKNKEKIVEDCKTKLPILERVTDKEIITDKKEPMNLMIEGDNYHALTCLNYTHKDKIDVIYIDPPYNTGKQDEWKYNDKYVDKEDRFRHSKWLNMMEKRLQLARNLLANDGVIFISIDDNEQANLKLLCDEIFGEQNFVNNFMWLHGKGKKTKQSRTMQQYNFVYAKNKFNLPFWLDCKMSVGSFSNPDNDNRGEWLSGSISFSEKRSNYNHNNFFKIKSPSGVEWQRQWQCTKKEMNNYLLENKIYFGPCPKYINVPRIKIFPNEETNIIPQNILAEHGTTREAQQNLDDILGSNVFANPKPVQLIKHFLKIIGDKNKKITVLDFFAGSGTTGHAVLQLNKEDGGSRKFILCTNNEGKIAEEVCYPRIQKVIEGYNKNGDGERVDALGSNLHYFKADEDSFIAIKTLKNISDKQRLALTLKAGELIAIRENIFDEKEHSSHYQIFEDDTRQVAIYFTEDQVKLAELVKTLDNKKEKVLYLFSWGKILLTGEDLKQPDITIKAIPEPIIKIYQEINK